MEDKVESRMETRVVKSVSKFLEKKKYDTKISYEIKLDVWRPELGQQIRMEKTEMWVFEEKKIKILDRLDREYLGNRGSCWKCPSGFESRLSERMGENKNLGKDIGWTEKMISVWIKLNIMLH